MAPRYSFAIPIIVGCAQFMHQFDGSVIATALPSMAATLHDDPLRLNLAISCYLLALAVFVPISGWMASRFGAKRVFTMAIVIFTISSILCGVSHSLFELVIARILQGMGGAMMTPVGRLIVVKTAPRADLVKAINYITIPAALAPILGPSVGGFIVTYFSWPWIFFLNVPIGLAGVLLVRRYIPEVHEEEVPPLDLRGFLLAAVALASMVFGFESMGRGAAAAAAGDRIARDWSDLRGSLCLSRQAHRKSDHRSQPHAVSDFRHIDNRRRPVLHGHQLVRLPARRSAAGGLRAFGISGGTDDARHSLRHDSRRASSSGRSCDTSGSSTSWSSTPVSPDAI